ncbi:diguanylate cyclase [Pokkaliibacter sp. CJK22405]|uniref:diguanylate cyclase n=1 Tax=Pokkaliibacter sp. CJK22405 TaxID=3384615 RepID=UPI003984E084
MSDELREQLRNLHKSYVASLGPELMSLRHKAECLGQDAGEDAQLLGELYLSMHRLTGSAGSFGLPALSDRARALEHFLADMGCESVTASELAKPLAQDQCQLIVDALKGMSREVKPVDDPLAVFEASEAASQENYQLLIIDENVKVGKSMASALESFGYDVALSPTIADGAVQLQNLAPDVMILGHSLTLAQQSIDETLRQLNSGELPEVPVMLVGESKDFHTLLEVVRAPVIGYFQRPVDMPRLQNRLERFLNVRRGVPYRILIIDDDRMLARRYELVLKLAGMDVSVVSEVERSLEVIASFHPDVILVDLNMPGCSGPELARIIRLHDEWLRIPILYVSSETDLDVQNDALSQAGDDFVTKPISDDSLTATLRARAARSRELSEAITRDSLTGLIKHAAIKEQLEIEIARAQRQSYALAVVMIDIDHFKKVNDTYGHASGDLVIRALANLLRQRLRRTDFVGRYGGEEFVVILPQCDHLEAFKRIDAIRCDFAELSFQDSGRSHRETFSAGVACLAANNRREADVETLLEQADAALYDAKSAGRNQVQPEKAN